MKCNSKINFLIFILIITAVVVGFIFFASSRNGKNALNKLFATKNPVKDSPKEFKSLKPKEDTQNAQNEPLNNIEPFDDVCKDLESLKRKDMIIYTNRLFSIPEKGTGRLNQFFNNTNLSYGIGKEKRKCCFSDDISTMTAHYEKRETITWSMGKAIFKVKCDKCNEEYALHAMADHNTEPHVLAYFLQYLQKRAFPHIITFYHLYYDSVCKEILIFTELLDNILEKDNILLKVDEKSLLKIAEELALAIGYLHMNNIIHSDIKPSNIGLKNGKIILFDFDRSLNYTVGYDMERSFTFFYAPYEVIKDFNKPGIKLDFGIDWYGYGMVLYELSLGKVSYNPGDSREQLIERAKNLQKHLNFTGKYGKDFYDFIKVLVLPDEKQRIGYGKDGFRRIIEHPYLKKSELLKRFKKLVNENINN